jgi:hypothetical protein
MATFKRASLLQRFSIWYPNSKVKWFVWLVNAIMSLVCVVIYCVNTYMAMDTLSKAIYITSSNCLIVQYVLEFMAVKNNNKMRFLLWSMSLIDLAVIIYGYLNFFDVDTDTDVDFLRVIRLIQVLRFMSMLMSIVAIIVNNAPHPMMAELYKYSTNLAVTFLGILFLCGCVFFELERVSEAQEFFSGCPNQEMVDDYSYSNVS